MAERAGAPRPAFDRGAASWFEAHVNSIYSGPRFPRQRIFIPRVRLSSM
jgi:hypothetical protein